MDRQSRKHIAQVLRAAATALEGAGYGSPMDPMVVMQEFNRRRRSMTHLLTFKLRGAMGNKLMVRVFFDGGRLDYDLIGPRNMPHAMSNLQLRQKLPQDVDSFPSVAALGKAIQRALNSGTARVTGMEQHEELD